MESFSINLVIADRLPSDATEDAVLDGMSKTDQILSEVHYKLSQVASNIKVSDISKIQFRDHDDDKLVVTRGEFSIDIARYTARLSEPIGGIDVKENNFVCAPVTIFNLETGETLKVPAGGSYNVAIPVKPTVIDNVNGVTKELEFGETYTVESIPDQYVLSFNYLVDTENSISVTVTSDEAAVYTIQQLTNVATVVYKVNEVVRSLPITLIPGDILTVEIAKTNATAASKVTLSSM
ncbi:hypothetical protein FVR03_16770 [Pontibacter qinzhouensis]|uniref:Uncharacterized protein n=1 Tax=Pontibacter qinzhouensis TaxID=2603253 RepID=A0A5C8JEC6_9BACT|nr:hypothetical protein [Pontibacter qinzhouensis]TXK36795.1 hypothetical protein FVR03_16770 [Pontibacter qinzhouensis]